VFLPEAAWDEWLDPRQRDAARLAAVMAHPEPVTFTVVPVEKPARPKKAAPQPELPLADGTDS
jgi:putative SOS response-associated peptidase YedK